MIRHSRHHWRVGVAHVSDIPWTATGACRVGRVNGQLVANPTHAEQAESDLDSSMSATPAAKS